MRIVLAGALGEVGSSLRRALVNRGHEVFALSSRAPLSEHPDVLDLNQVRSFVQVGAVDAIVNAGGPGDHRSRADSVSEWSQQLLDACRGKPAVLISSTRVLEGFEHRPNEDASGKPLTPYGRANSEHEQLWLEAPHGRVLRLVNFFCSPTSVDSPQAKLLPWSLLLEGWQTGHIGVRSREDTSKEFVDSDDVARAVEVMVASESARRTVVAGPGAVVTLRDLGEASISACAKAGLLEVQASFGTESPNSSWSMAPGFLAGQGWTSELTLERMTQEMTQWLVEWGSTIPHSGRDRG